MTNTSPMREKIIATYDQHILRKSILSIRGGAGVLESVLGSRKYKVGLEIGTYRGVGAAEMSQYCERVITIDLKRGKLEHNKSRGDPTDSKHDRHAFWASLGITNIDLILVENDAEKAEIINALDFDFAMIDGAHDQTVANDFALVKRCGTVLFHDIDRSGSKEKDYVIDFFESLPASERQVLDIFGLWTAPGG